VLQPPSEDPREVLRQLVLRQTETEARLHRVENSLLFRALRWAGNKVGYRPGGDSDQDYQKWVEQRGWFDPPSADGEPATWQPIARLTAANAAEWRTALCRVQSEYCAVVPTDVRLSPRAECRWNELLRDRQFDAVYSDWDHIDAAGRPHSPRFTPGFSPGLLRHSGYWGACFVVRTSLLREIGQDTDPSQPGWTHTLTRRAGTAAATVGRIPHILWHSANSPAAIESPAATVAGDPSQASIVICTRTPKLAERCLRLLRASDAAQAEIVVVAHDCEMASGSGTTIVRYSGQFHYGLINELGVARTTRPVVVLLNDDVEPIAPDWLSALTGALRDDSVGIAGGLLLYPDGSVQHAGISVGGRTTPAHLGRGQISSKWWPWLRVTREVAAVTGACMAMRRTVWDELGGFDRRFPVNYNDVDLCLRARRAGYSAILESAAVLRHREAQTRTTAVMPAELKILSSLWARELTVTDPFFNPNLELPDERIVLAPPLYTNLT